ncbi:1,4-alpha-glucan branching protein [Myxococcus stipitatus DSM 14675]|uniref:1,4-alpha-glucan branching enzyme n=1 Tax=Myxococcus stipitatus (strain DSM 14675 / JCM 12634 / Mx s8) TaxID=1278073 RepID=L7UGN5_MYXSD|nr:alpha-amylase family glycosyl hydrolase [Myxococcus stipitatus]AGC47198.1 1,4-alpha-glucan branching protein [Myxococcus stipitatus DSM 14675]
MRRNMWSALLLAGVLGCAESALENPLGTKGEETGQVVQRLSSSNRPGMGAVVYGGGTTFRVWAPLASQVFVAGDFSSWGWVELGNEFNGNFSGDVAGAVKGQKYKFVTRNQWGSDSWRADPRSAWQENSTGASIIYDHGEYWWNAQQFSTPAFHEMVIYELHVGTFNDSPGWGPGNWNSAIAKLDYLRDLGVNMVKVMPAYEFAGDFSWGYNVAFPFAPESAYGHPNDMKRFVDEAHYRGIGVIVDVVHNHWGPSDLPMWCFSGNCLGNGGEYFFTDNRKSTPWGDTRPDYGRPEVRAYIRDSMMNLLDNFRADGLRWDATKYMRTIDGAGDIAPAWQVFRSINREINANKGWKISIAEDFGGGDSITNDATSDFAGGAGFDAQWSAEFVHPIRTAVIEQNDANRNMFAVRDAITQRFSGRAHARVIYSESHDEVANGKQRLPEEIWPGQAGSWAAKKRSTLAAGVTLTSPGIPMLFQGQEILEDGFFADGDPVDWGKLSTYGGIHDLYRDLIRLRRNWSNNTRGLRGGNVNVHHVNNTGKVLAYHRWDSGGPGDDVLIVANFSGTYFPTYNIGFPRTGTWYLRFNSDWNGYSSDFGNTASANTVAYGGAKDGMANNASFAIGPYSLLIFSQ